MYKFYFLKDALSVNKNYENQESQNKQTPKALNVDSKPMKETTESVKQQSNLADPENKENIVGTTLPTVGSALDMIYNSKSSTQNIDAVTNPVIKEKQHKTPAHNNQNTSIANTTNNTDKHRRTLSTNSASKTSVGVHF
jgi:hypothetical protein